MRFKILSFFLIMSVGFASAQTFYTSGYVKDDESGEPLSGVLVKETVTGLSTHTNADGYFILPLPAGDRILLSEFPNYISHSDSFFLGQNTLMTILLKESFFSEVDGLTENPPDQLDEIQPGNITIDAAKLQYIPVLLAEPDFVKNLQLLPGITNGLDGSSGFNVRGGGTHDNVILLDGFPVYNINHYFGFFSGISNEAVKSFDLYKGPTPARFGSRTSSVLDVHTKDGNMEETRGTAGISMMSFFGFVEGPIVPGKTSYMFSGRRTYPGLFNVFNPLATFTANEVSNSYFYDVNFKLTHLVSDKDKVQLMFFTNRDRYYAEISDAYYSGADAVEDIARDEVNWTNLNASMRWTHVMSKKAFATFVGGYTRYRFNIISKFNRSINGEKVQDYNINYLSGLQDAVLKADVEYWHSSTQHIRYGIWQTLHMFDAGEVNAKFNGSGNSYDTSIGNSSIILGNELAAYIEDEISISKRTHANLGMRVSSFASGGAFFVLPEPRASIRFKYNDQSSWKLGYSWNNQYLHHLNNTGLNLQSDLWVPASDDLKPSQSHQINGTWVRKLGDKGWELVFDVYYKWLRNAIDFKEGTSTNTLEFDWRKRLEQGKGKAYGMEVMIQRKFGKLNGWLSYTLSKNDRLFANINNGLQYPADYDRRHAFNLSIIYLASETYTFSINTTYGTGYSVNFPYGVYYDINGNLVYDYQGKNSYQLRDYFRIDASIINERNNPFTAGSQEFIISVYNLTNRFNPVYAYIDTSGNKPVGKEVSLLPFIPAITYKFNF